MKKRYVALLLLGYIVSLYMFSRRRKTKYATKPKSKDNLKLKDDNKFTYLTPITFDAGKYLGFIVYCLREDLVRVNNKSYFGIMDGVTTEVRMLSPSELSPKLYVQDSIKSKKLALMGNSKLFSDLEEMELQADKDHAFQGIRYNCNIGGKFPCFYIVKIVRVLPDVCIKMCIDIDGSQCTDRTLGILKEIEEAYGITLDFGRANNE